MSARDRVEIRVTPEERREIQQSHGPLYEPLITPRCSLCGERWEDGGCPTYRMALMFDTMERTMYEQRRVAEAAIADLSVFAGAAEFSRIPSRDVMSITVDFDAALLVRYGIRMIDHTLRDVRKRIEAWHDKVSQNPAVEVARAFNAALADAKRRNSPPAPVASRPPEGNPEC